MAVLEPPEGTRLILVSEDLLEYLGSRTESGHKLTAEWGDKRPEGWYEPFFTMSEDEGSYAMRDGRALQKMREALPDFRLDSAYGGWVIQSPKGGWWTPIGEGVTIADAVWDALFRLDNQDRTLEERF